MMFSFMYYVINLMKTIQHNKSANISTSADCVVSDATPPPHANRDCSIICLSTRSVDCSVWFWLIVASTISPLSAEYYCLYFIFFHPLYPLPASRLIVVFFVCVFVSSIGPSLPSGGGNQPSGRPVRPLVHVLDSVGDGYGSQIDTAHAAACSCSIHDGVVGVW